MNSIVTWAIAHQMYAWFIFWSVVLLVCRLKSPQEWIDFADRSPRAHALLVVARGAGFDPVEIVQGLLQFVTGRAQPPPGSGRARPNNPAAPPSTPSVPTGLTLGMAMGASLAVAVGCAWLSSPAAKVVERQILTDVQIACVLEHSLLLVPTLEQVCSIEQTFAPAIETLLAAHKEASRREHMGACPHPLDTCDPWANGGKDAGGDSARDAGKEAAK